MGWTYEYINDLPMPYVFEQLDYFSKMRSATGTYSESQRSNQPSALEMNTLGADPRPFSKLPLALQESLKNYKPETH